MDQDEEIKSEEVSDEVTEDDDESTEDDKQVDDEEVDGEQKDEITTDERKELEALRKKEFNFKKMRENGKKTKDEVKKAKEELTEGWSEFREATVKERKADALELLVGDDVETRKKVLYNFSRIDADKPVFTKEDIYKRMKEAASMLGMDQNPNIISKGGHSGYRGNSAKSETPESIAMRKEMKITDEQKKKYSGKDWEPKY